MKRMIHHGILIFGLLTSGVAKAAVPTATTLPGSSVGPVATLSGSVNPGGADTTAWFEWGQVANCYTNATTPVSVGSGGGSVTASNLISGLTPGFVYHYRVVASNAFGLTCGRDIPFGSPALVLNGNSVVTNELHAGFVDPGATATGGLLGIAGGWSHSLVLKSDGPLVGWGDNQYGNTNIPAGLSDVVTIDAGDWNSMALKGDGTVAVWGLAFNGSQNIPEDLTNAVALQGGYDGCMALKDDGRVVAWGSYTDGQTNVPIDLSNVVAIAAGRFFNMALKNDGTITAWGFNDQGQTNVPAGLTNVTAIAAGGYHALALTDKGRVFAWGDNQFGQTIIPPGLSNVVAIAGGMYHSLALKSDGTVVAWGDNSAGQTNVPAGLTNVVLITGGFGHSLAAKNDGTVVGWGNPRYFDWGQSIVPTGLNILGVSVVGCVNTDVPGSYPLTYTSTNAIGGVTVVARTVVVIQSPIAPPVLTGFTTISNGMFQFVFSNVPGTSFTVFASTNVALPLDSWTNLGPAVEVPAGSGQFQFSDPQATNLVQRFYRVRSP